MKRQFLKVYPLLVAVAVCVFLLWVRRYDTDTPRSPSIFQRLEWMSHDWRVRLAYSRPSPNAATNLVAVEIEESTLKWMNKALPGQPRWPFTYFYYAPFISELKTQGVAGVAFDVFFAEQDTVPQTPWPKITGTTNSISGQAFFAERLRTTANVILSTGSDRLNNNKMELPVGQLYTNAIAVGHPLGNFNRDGVVRSAPAFVDDAKGGRVWAIGVVLAARHLGLDLARAEVSPERIVLRGEGGVIRDIPLAAGNVMLLDWVVHPRHPSLPGQRVQRLTFGKILNGAIQRELKGRNDDLGLRGKLVVVGAGGTGVNIYDRGATALDQRDTFYLAHMNFANSVLTGRFVRPLGSGAEAWIAVALTALATILGWKMRALWASLAIGLVATAYVGLAVWIYIAHRILLPVALPVFGALITTHLVMTACRAAENAERRQVQRLLKKVVSPKIIDTLLTQDSPMPQTHRVEITVFFADLRGFTRFSEEAQIHAEAAAHTMGLSDEAARMFADEAAATAMSSVNRYLAAVVDEIKATDGTLDKYMGDCVMAFWGAPVPDPNHAMQALKCAAAVQQSIERINREFGAENQRRDQENQSRQAQKQPPLPLLPVLRLGIGLNSGLATVGFMGSENHLSSYTAFGHVVNVASRVEGLAGGGQIVLAEQTLLAAARNDATIAARCARLPEVYLKGITTPVKLFELCWKNDSTGAVSVSGT